VTIVGRIASRMQRGGSGLRANAISERDLRDVLEQFFVEWSFPPPRAGRAAAEMLQLLQERNWVLTLRGPALYGFVHRTFLEYLCALDLSERFKAQQLDIRVLIADHVAPQFGDDAWREPLRLPVGLLPPTAAERMLLAILPSESDVATNAPRLALAWLGLAEIEPRHIPTLINVCAQLTDVLYAWLAGTTMTDNDIRTAFEIADAARI